MGLGNFPFIAKGPPLGFAALDISQSGAFITKWRKKVLALGNTKKNKFLL